MHTFARVGQQFLVIDYELTGVKVKARNACTFNNSLEAVEYLIRKGVPEMHVSAAYTAMVRRGYTKAYFGVKGVLFYLTGVSKCKKKSTIKNN